MYVITIVQIKANRMWCLLAWMIYSFLHRPSEALRLRSTCLCVDSEMTWGTWAGSINECMYEVNNSLQAFQKEGRIPQHNKHVCRRRQESSLTLLWWAFITKAFHKTAPSSGSVGSSLLLERWCEIALISQVSHYQMKRWLYCAKLESSTHE